MRHLNVYSRVAKIPRKQLTFRPRNNVFRIFCTSGVAVIGLLTIATVNSFGADPIRNHPYKREYKKQTFGKKAVVSAVGHGAVGEIRNRPKEWGRGPSGFTKRVGSGFATNAVKNSIEYPIASALHEDLHYHRSTKHGVGPRLGYALKSTVITQKTTTHRKTFATGRVSGAVGSGMISRAWQPAARTAGAGFASAGVTLGGEAAANVTREFLPRRGGKKAAPVRPTH
jgi:hypothetical protein